MMGARIKGWKRDGDGAGDGAMTKQFNLRRLVFARVALGGGGWIGAQVVYSTLYGVLVPMNAMIRLTMASQLA